MAKGKCKRCGGETSSEAYMFCYKCSQDIKKEKENETSNHSGDSKEIVDLLEKCNWNFGALQKFVKWSLLNDLEKTKEKKKLTEIQKKMLVFLSDRFEKDEKNILDIEAEQKKEVKNG